MRNRRNLTQSPATVGRSGEGMRESGMGSPPISRVLSSNDDLRRHCRAVIPLGAALPRRSSSLPGSNASRVGAPLFGLAPDGVYRASPVASPAVGSYPTVSPLPDPPKGPSAVCSLLHFPSPHDARPLAGILLCGARTFLHAPTVRSDCLANFPRTLYADASRQQEQTSAHRS